MAKNAIELLKDDHDRMEEILKNLTENENLSKDEAKEQVRLLERRVKIHTAIEEEIFYPAFKNAAREKNDREMYFEAIEEHHVADMVLPELKAGDGASEQFRAKAKVLRELIMHHADEEEDEMFPRAETLLAAGRLVELGEEMEARMVELEKEWEKGLSRAMHKMKSVADKFAPTSAKDKRVDDHRSERR